MLGARHHQEMFDGKGYPHGLKGERIPLHGRIIAVADTYDSITSSRASSRRSHEVAMKEIERVAGTQLDLRLWSIQASRSRRTRMVSALQHQTEKAAA